MELTIKGTPLEISMLLGYLHDLMRQNENQAISDLEKLHVDIDGKEVSECISPK